MNGNQKQVRIGADNGGWQKWVDAGLEGTLKSNGEPFVEGERARAFSLTRLSIPTEAPSRLTLGTHHTLIQTLWKVLTLLWRGCLMNVTATRGGGGGVPSTDTKEFLRQSIQIIDGVFGDGYAKKKSFASCFSS